ncbi:hypothetical protein ACFQT4_22690 [Pseudoduganella danionis]|uniref:hypothetical protein n=1 Tax=Pseudoduganella danionis TaxID=1890295 RepID=UPI00360DE344
MRTRTIARPLLLSTLISTIVIPAFAQQLPAEGELQSVVVTGTYAKNRRTVDSESPIDIIGARELQASGSTELATVLGRLLPSMNFPVRPAPMPATQCVRPSCAACRPTRRWCW